MSRILAGVSLFVLQLLYACPLTQADNSISLESLDRSVVLESEDELVEAYGLVIVEPRIHGVVLAPDPNLALTRPSVIRRPATLEQIDEKTWRARMQLEMGDLALGARVTVIATTGSGEAVSSPVRYMSLQGRRRETLSCQPGSLGEPGEKISALTLATAQKVLKIKQKRRALLADVLNRLLDKRLLVKLNSLEVEHGLARSTPLTAETPLEEFAARIALLDSLVGQSEKQLKTK